MARTKEPKLKAKPSGKLPTPPAWLQGEPRDEYTRLAKVLDERGTLSQTDTKLLEIYAISYHVLITAYRELVALGTTTGGAEGGRKYKHPQLDNINNASQKLRQVIADLGLSPTAAKLVEAKGLTSAESHHWGNLLDG